MTTLKNMIVSSLSEERSMNLNELFETLENRFGDVLPKKMSVNILEYEIEEYIKINECYPFVLLSEEGSEKKYRLLSKHENEMIFSAFHSLPLVFSIEDLKGELRMMSLPSSLDITDKKVFNIVRHFIDGTTFFENSLIFECSYNEFAKIPVSLFYDCIREMEHIQSDKFDLDDFVGILNGELLNLIGISIELFPKNRQAFESAIEHFLSDYPEILFRKCSHSESFILFSAFEREILFLLASERHDKHHYESLFDKLSDILKETEHSSLISQFHPIHMRRYLDEFFSETNPAVESYDDIHFHFNDLLLSGENNPLSFYAGAVSTSGYMPFPLLYRAIQKTHSFLSEEKFLEIAHNQFHHFNLFLVEGVVLYLPFFSIEEEVKYELFSNPSPKSFEEITHSISKRPYLKNIAETISLDDLVSKTLLHLCSKGFVKMSNSGLFSRNVDLSFSDFVFYLNREYYSDFLSYVVENAEIDSSLKSSILISIPFTTNEVINVFEFDSNFYLSKVETAIQKLLNEEKTPFDTNSRIDGPPSSEISQEEVIKEEAIEEMLLDGNIDFENEIKKTANDIPIKEELEDEEEEFFVNENIQAIHSSEVGVEEIIEEEVLEEEVLEEEVIEEEILEEEILEEEVLEEEVLEEEVLEEETSDGEFYEEEFEDESEEEWTYESNSAYPDYEAFCYYLTDLEREFLKLFIRNNNSNVYTQFLKKRGVMISKFVDGINEKALDYLGDIVLEEVGKNEYEPNYDFYQMLLDIK